MNQFPPASEYSIKAFRILKKFAEIFASQGAPLVSRTPEANFSTNFGSVVDTGGKFGTGVNDTSNKFSTKILQHLCSIPYYT
jgi:hypothetical protein